MMMYERNNSSEDIVRMEMEHDQRMTFRKGRPCRRQTGIFVLLGTVCMFIFMVMTFVIFLHQQRKFSVLENWMKNLNSSATSVKADYQIAERQQDLSQNEMKGLMNSLSSAVSALTSKLNDADSLLSSLSDLKSSVSDLTSSVASLSSKQQTAEERIMNVIKELKTNRSEKTADVPVSCKSGWIAYKSSCFLFSSVKLNWSEAQDYCKEKGALLLKIQDDDMEWAFLNHRTLPTNHWVGLTDQNTGQWRWADETPYTMNKERWDPNQPDEWEKHGLGEGGEDCGEISNTGKLNDRHCSSKLNFICRM